MHAGARQDTGCAMDLACEVLAARAKRKRRRGLATHPYVRLHHSREAPGREQVAPSGRIGPALRRACCGSGLHTLPQTWQGPRHPRARGIPGRCGHVSQCRGDGKRIWRGCCVVITIRSGRVKCVCASMPPSENAIRCAPSLPTAPLGGATPACGERRTSRRNLLHPHST